MNDSDGQSSQHLRVDLSIPRKFVLAENLYNIVHVVDNEAFSITINHKPSNHPINHPTSYSNTTPLHRLTLPHPHQVIKMVRISAVVLACTLIHCSLSIGQWLTLNQLPPPP